ncbi:glycoside hydrolase family 19 protein [Mucilaginibacter sp. KACC 22063]|uniref:glycoside hydrolase family 19 protein n=1 Tax=Mucilaginibacter sp. KACC 22063 TaxID=3025666 RepID=UPI002365FB53|nr:hypothetical protein [Mucilaginibacter sp. KACC 22063]WDF54380.1 hypothetical protein PQ461_15665 [Mucilaginibacter sp. KACC 22063]
MAGGTITETAGGSITTTVKNDYDVYGERVNLNAGKKVSLHGEENGVVLNNKPKDPPPGKATVIKAYFAKKVQQDVVTKTENYTIVKGDTQKSIVAAHKGVKLKDIPKKPVPGKTVALKYYEKKYVLDRIKSAILGSKVFLVAETAGLKDATLTFEVLGSNNTTFVSPDQTVTILQDGAEKTDITAKVGEYATKTEFDKADSIFANRAVAEVELKPKEADTAKDWAKKINDSKEKKAYLHLTVKAQSDLDVQYNNEDDKVTQPTKDKGIYLNKSDLWFILKTCFCNRELDKDDLMLMGISEAKAKDYLDGFNEAIKTYQINTCLRILHFVAQVKVESGSFTLTKEIWGPTAVQKKYEGRTDLGNTEKGDGYRFLGRGLIQITGRTNYTAYGNYKGQNFTTEPNNEKLENAPYSIDSAAWYWHVHLSPTDLNVDADNDDPMYCTYRINGGFTHYRDREGYAKSIIKTIGTCVSTDLSKKGTYKLSTSKCNNYKDAVYKWANLLHDEHDANSSEETSKTAYQRYITLTQDSMAKVNAKLAHKPPLPLTKSEKSLKSKVDIATERSR